jgi:N-[(2S)-2-amino-2-carboxyethyl]-L-glutamate dehydrogenase
MHITLLRSEDVLAALSGREDEIIRVVQQAYETHEAGLSALPHSSFLRFPDKPGNRIIALPTYLGGDFQVAGLKWIASFPDNHKLGLNRASAVIILNSIDTGLPEALIEGSIISAKRTAASAALAARFLHVDKTPICAGFVGCGLINLEIARFLRSVFPSLASFIVYDLYGEKSQHFVKQCEELFEGVEVVIAETIPDIFKQTSLVSMATTASRPHISDLSNCQPGTTILHISLRDIAPEVLVTCDNIVDDIDHVCREQTSVHLTEQVEGNRNFIRCTLASITKGVSSPRRSNDDTVIFSPFGLGVLDLALSAFVLERAMQLGKGEIVKSFFPSTAPSRQ